MEIGLKNGYPASAVSNLQPHQFTIDGIMCNSMEGFLQSLKFKDINMQIEVCKLVGMVAKRKGANKKWKDTQTLYWQGQPYKRNSKEYQLLLDRAYDQLYENSSFKKALLATNNSTLKHSIGKIKITDTVITRKEFCSRLYTLRTRAQKEKTNVK